MGDFCPRFCLGLHHTTSLASIVVSCDYTCHDLMYSFSNWCPPNMLRFQFLVFLIKRSVMLEITKVGGSRDGRGVNGIKMERHQNGGCDWVITALLLFTCLQCMFKRGWASVIIVPAILLLWLPCGFSLIEDHLSLTQKRNGGSIVFSAFDSNLSAFPVFFLFPSFSLLQAQNPDKSVSFWSSL